MTSQNPRAWLSVKEVVAEFGMSEPFWNKLRCKGGGPPYSKIGNSIRYRRGDVERWFEEQQRKKTNADEAA